MHRLILLHHKKSQRILAIFEDNGDYIVKKYRNGAKYFGKIVLKTHLKRPKSSLICCRNNFIVIEETAYFNP